MGCVRPARRFDARRALASRDLPSRIAPDGGPPCAFALLQRSIATPPHRPAGPKADRRTMLPPLGFLAVRHVPERRTRVSRSLPAPLRAASGVWVPPSRRPPPSLPTPCGAGASIGLPPQGLLLASIGSPFGDPCPRGVARVDSPRPPGGRADAVDSRASIPARIPADHRIPKDPARGCLHGVTPSRALPPAGLCACFGSQGLPPHALDGVTSGPTCVSGSCGAEGSVGPSRGYRLSWVSSPCDRRGNVPVVARGGLIASPHDSRALQAARTDLSPIADDPADAEASTRRPPSIGEETQESR